MKRTTAGVAALAIAAAGLTAMSTPATANSTAGNDPCSDPLPQGSEPVTLDPADFVSQIDNPYWPMTPGSRWVYREADSHSNAQKVVVRVTARSKQILGISATVVHDVVSKHGQLVENTFDWYAQDVCGNLWYLGENTKEYEDGVVVSTAGTWESGVDGAQAGIALAGDPQVGLTYRQEYYAGEAEDSAQILGLDEKAQVPAGYFRHVQLTKDSTALRPRVLEYKLYAKGVGPVLELGISGGSDRAELVRFHTP